MIRLETTDGKVVKTIQAKKDIDYFVCLDGINSKRKKTRIVVSTASDENDDDNGDKIIQDFHGFCQMYKPYQIVISAIRDEGDPCRKTFNKIMKITNKDDITEIPLGKITKQGKNKDPRTYENAKRWYKNGIDEIAHFLLSLPPFSI
jgi:hypothetical protein